MAASWLSGVVGLICWAATVILWCMTPWWVALLASLVLVPVGFLSILGIVMIGLELWR